MNKSEVIKLLDKHNLSIEAFYKWMNGQTVGIKNGELDYYEYDVDRFINMFGWRK